MPTEQKFPIRQTVAEAIADEQLPGYIRDFLRASLKRDAYIAWYDAQIAADLLKAHYEGQKSPKPSSSL